MNGVQGLLIHFAIRLLVSYIIIRIIYSWILHIRIYFIQDKLQSVKAKRIKHISKIHRNDPSDMQSAVYEYYVNGKRYTAHFGFSTDRDIFPLESTLYYRSNPKNACWDKNSVKTEDQEKQYILIIASGCALFLTILQQVINMLINFG